MTVRRWIENKNGDLQPVNIKRLKKWNATHVKIGRKNGRNIWKDKKLIEKEKEPPKVTKTLEVYFFRFNAEYDKASDSLKIEIRYVGLPDKLKDFKKHCQYQVTMDYNATVAGNATIEIADLDDDDSLGDFQFLRNGREFDYKALKDELDKDVGS